MSQTGHTFSGEIEKAQTYLNRSGEVYFRFFLNSYNEITLFSPTISIDRVEGHTVYAYANKDEFSLFIKHDRSFEVLLPPGMEGPMPEMSDYKDIRGPLLIDKYPTYEGYLELMKRFESDYPALCKLYEIGTTVKGRKLLVLKVSKNVNDREKEPKFFHSSTIHGDETAGFALILNMVNYLLGNYGKERNATGLLDSIELWVCPLMNPDGTYKGGNNTVFGSTRANANGKDLNRNYPVPKPSGMERSAYKAEPETEALMKFESEHNFVLSIDNHGGIEAAFYPWSSTSKNVPDLEWFKLVSKTYADIVHKTAPSSHFKGAGGDGWGNWNREMYLAVGTRPDWQYGFRHCREITCELSITKTLSESNFQNWWDYHKDETLYFYRQMFCGILGTVTDSITQKGIPAKVSVEKLDKDSSWVYADMPQGNYYRPILQGTYDVTFSSPGYHSRTVSGISVQTDKGTVVDVKLKPAITAVQSHIATSADAIAIQSTGTCVKIRYALPLASGETAIYDMAGKRIKSFHMADASTSGLLVWDSRNDQGTPVNSGCYVFKSSFAGKPSNKSFLFVRN